MHEHEHAGPVTIFATNDPATLAVAQSLLEEADIEFVVAGASIAGLFPGGAAGACGVPEIRVATEDADAARELLKDLE